MNRRADGGQGRRDAAITAEEFEASGLTRREFAARAGMSVATLDYRRARARGGGRWVEVELTQPVRWPGASPLTLELGNGRRIEVGEGFESETLARLLAVAEKR